MRVPTLAACALTVLAVQEPGQQAIASTDVSTTEPETGGLETSNLTAVDEADGSAMATAVAPPELAVDEPRLNYASDLPAQPIAVPTETTSALPGEDAIAHSAIASVDTASIKAAKQAEQELANLKRDLDAIAPSRPSHLASDLVDLPVIVTPALPAEPASVSPGLSKAPQYQQEKNLSTQRPDFNQESLRQESFSQESLSQESFSQESLSQESLSQESPPILRGLPQDFILPILPEIATDASITTNTPITDQEFPDPLPRSNVGGLEQLARYQEARTLALKAWAGEVRSCLLDYPRFVVTAPNGTQRPILFNGSPGRVVRNANGRLVCRL